MNSNQSSGKNTPSSASIWMGMLAIYIFWGSTYLAIRYAVTTIPPFLMAGTRFLVAGGILMILRRMAGDPFPRWFEWRSAWIIGWFLLLGGNGGVVWAEQTVPSSLAALIVGTVPLWIVLIDAVRPRGNRPGWPALLGVGIGFVGILLLFWPFPGSGEAPEQINLAGLLVLLLGAISWATGSLYGRKARLPQSPLMGSAMEMLMGGTGLIILGGVTGEFRNLNLHQISWQSDLGMAYLILFGSLAGFTAYTWLIRVAPISLVSTYAYVNPLVAIALGFIIAREPITIRSLVAAAIILGSVVLTTRINAKPKAEISLAPNPEPMAED